MVTVDNPVTTEGVLKEVLPDVQVKMDVGHVLYKRFGRCFDKAHPMYGESRGGFHARASTCERMQAFVACAA